MKHLGTDESLGTTHFLVASIAALVLAFFLYAPALDGPFLFDDLGLPFYVHPGENSLRNWVAGVRPVLMFSYWLNHAASGVDTWAYHASNVLLHALNSVLVLALFLRLLRIQQVDSRKAIIAAAAAALVFLVHPLQTEAVAYIAGRSELLAAFFSLAALTVYARPGAGRITWPRSVVIVALYGAAVMSKEQAAVLPAVFVIIDVVVRRLPLKEALRTNGRLYVPLALAAVLAAAAIAALLDGSATAGFRLTALDWQSYLATQFRVWLLYVGLAVLPFGQNPDYDLPLSRTLAEHGSAIALVILASWAVLVWRFRRPFPLLLAGVSIFAVLLLPTSSVVPINDVVAERRMYLPLMGLLLAFVQLLVTIEISQQTAMTVAAFIAVCGALTFQRAAIWSSDIAFWSETTSRSPQKSRGYAHLAVAYLRQRRCAEAVEAVHRAPERVRNTPEVLSALGNALACQSRTAEAIAAFERAVVLKPAVGRILALARMYRQAGRETDAALAEQHALTLSPRTRYDFAMLEAFRGAREGSRGRTATP